MTLHGISWHLDVILLATLSRQREVGLDRNPERTAEELGLNPHRAEAASTHHWDYPTLENAPPLHPDASKWSSSIYRGLVPAKNILRRDFAVNGACVSTD